MKINDLFPRTGRSSLEEAASAHDQNDVRLKMKRTRSGTTSISSRRALGAIILVLITGSLLALMACNNGNSSNGGSSTEFSLPTVGSDAPAAELIEVDDPGTTPMCAAAIDLAAFGYTEREFYAEGDAQRYRGAISSSFETAEPIDGGYAYRTRVLVRAPEPEHFNGTLIVEWTNVTLGQDADFVFGEVHNEILREGYAYAVVSAQRVGVQRLTTWSPDRYGDLSVEADNVDPDTGDPVDSGGDVLSWDIMTQIAEALKDNAGENPPLPGLTVERVIATGQSQSAIRLTSYYNTIRAMYNIFDGFVFWDRSTQLRSDLPVPAISVNSEALAPTWIAPPTTEYTRAWDVAGTTHGSLYCAQYMDAMFLRDASMDGPDGSMSFNELVGPSCDMLPPFSTVPGGLVVTAAFDAVCKWITTGEEAAPSNYFSRDSEDVLIFNADGLVEGGIRLSQFSAPTAENNAVNGNTFPCSISGSHRYYTVDELITRYGTHDQYVAEVRAAMEQAQADGYLLPVDADGAIQAAEASTVAEFLSETVKVTGGYVYGTLVGGPANSLRAYRGIPYAAPPVGDLRWKAPQPVVPWDGVLDCTTFPADPVAFTPGGFLPPTEQDEDCLTLNIITPAKSTSENLPVMVYFHGGAYMYGSGNEDWVANRTQLAEQGVVYVNVNERLAALGLLCHPLLNAEAGRSGNYMILDLIQSLQWVQANIAAFGGDPNNVTIFGESGGGCKVSVLMTSPLANGLFHRAINMSGTVTTQEPMWHTLTEEEMYVLGEALFTAMGVTTLEEARAVPWEDVKAAAMSISIPDGADPGLYYWKQVIDGYVLEDTPQAVFEAGEQNAVPLMVTTTKGEQSSISWLIPAYEPMLQSQWELGVPSYAALWDQVPANWRALGYNCSHATDLAYVFGDMREESPMWYMILPALGGHFGGEEVELRDVDRMVSQQSSAIFAQFAKTGTPSVNTLVDWPTWDPTDEAYLYINDTLTIREGFSTITP